MHYNKLSRHFNMIWKLKQRQQPENNTMNEIFACKMIRRCSSKKRQKNNRVINHIGFSFDSREKLETGEREKLQKF
jgi:hypothetical protein